VALDHAGVDIPGIKQVFYGVVLLVVVVLKPDGVWPWVAKKLGLAERER
jgi:branched-chain amino acid transport system permease protein